MERKGERMTNKRAKGSAAAAPKREKSSETEITGLLLNGKVQAGEPTIALLSPWDRTVVARVSQASREVALGAVDTSVRVFPATRALPGYERQRILLGIGEKLIRERKCFADIIVSESGKPIQAALAEVDRAAFTFRAAAEEAVRQGGEILPLDRMPGAEGRWGMLRRFPIGPILAITPFNFPLNLVAHKVAPAIAAGCPILVKPAPETPLSALALGRAVVEAGWPAEAISVLPMANEDAEWLVEHEDRLKMLSFTGSARVGWHLKAKAGKKRVVLELGGNAALIVHSDCGDLSAVVAKATAGAFTFSGQSCISVQRIYVERPIFQTFVWKMVESVGRLVMGDPSQPETQIGPVMRPADAERILAWIGDARKHGAKVVAGGSASGSMVEPTVLSGTRSPMKVVDEEIFGPVVAIEAYDEFDSALSLVNKSRFGLQAGLFTRDSERIFRAYEALEVGALIVGDAPSWRMDSMPYGGVKDSGEGLEGIRWAIDEMTQSKLLVMKM
jgi:acyl-CoA reductase-like NAD-dependent aldehyde dehydrogenase